MASRSATGWRRPSRAARKALEETLSQHAMSYENGRCLCGIDLKGSFAEAEKHFHEAAFAAGAEFAPTARKEG